MADEYDAERKFLAKNYKAFLYDWLYALKYGTGKVHLHPPPAFHHVYDIIIRHSAERKDNELDYQEIIHIMDQVARFVSYLNKNGIEYDGFTECASTRLTTDDLQRLLTSGGDDR